MNDIYNTWKPLRNYLARLEPKDAIEVLRYYSLFEGNMKDLPPSPPSYIEVHQAVFTQNNGILPWDIEVLAREIIYACEEHAIPRYSLRSWTRFSKAINLLKIVDNSISKESINPENVLIELFRIAHRQFPHQTNRYSQDTIVRYSKLFLHGNMREITMDKLGIDLAKMLTIGLIIIAKYKEFSTIEAPTGGWPEVGVSANDIQHFFDFFSQPYTQIKSEITARHVVDNTFFYQYNPLVSHPIIEFKVNDQKTYTCASVPMLESQITRGLYYSLYTDSRFDNAFGGSFEYYTGSMLTKTLAESNDTIFGAETDSSHNKRRCDWIIDQEEGFVIVECKTKRMAMPGYTTLDNDLALIAELSKLAEAVVQSYEAYIIYRDIGYSPAVYTYSASKNASICVVTIEKWFLFSNQLKKLREIVIQQLTGKDIDISIINTVPYAVVGIDDLEKLAFLASKGHDLASLIKSHNNVDNEANSWEFFVYVSHEHKKELEEYQYIFKDEFDSVFTEQARQIFESADTQASKA